MIMPFNLGSPLFQWNTGQKLQATGLANDESYAHFRAPSEIFCEVNNSVTGLTIKVTDERAYYEESESTGLTFTYSGTSWQVGSPASDVDLADYGISVTGTPVANNSFSITLTDLVSVAVEDGLCEIPNRLLQFSGSFLVYGYTTDDNGDLTISQEQFNVIARPLPPSYIYDPTEVISYPALAKLVADLTALKAILSVWSATIDNNIGTPSVDVSMTSSGTALAFHNLKGNGITSVSKTSTSGLTDTYTITFANGTTTTFAVTNGKGISSIAKTGTSGLVDTYTITYNDATTSTFTVTNGEKGDAATIAVGTTTTGEPGTSASVVNSGTSSAAVFDFTIPKGSKGDKGDAATIAVGTTTTGEPGTSASVVNSGTSSAAVFDFTIPEGEQGDKGDTGNGISSIAKTSTSGNVDTYTITFTDGTTTTFTVTNGSVTSVNGETGDVVLPLVVSDNLLCCRWEES